VQQVIVKLGPTRGDQVAILSGIKEGDVIVTSGQLKLKNDTPVNINNKVEPAFNPNPHPVEE
jgi:membrane fusion protein (multidrug efflux system)